MSDLGLKLNEELNNRGWTCQKHISNEDLYQQLIEFAFQSRQNLHFKQPLIIPAELILDGSNEVIGVGHLLYIKDVEHKHGEHDGFSAPCTHVKTGEYLRFEIPINYK